MKNVKTELVLKIFAVGWVSKLSKLCFGESIEMVETECYRHIFVIWYINWVYQILTVSSVAKFWFEKIEWRWFLNISWLVMNRKYRNWVFLQEFSVSLVSKTSNPNFSKYLQSSKTSKLSFFFANNCGRSKVLKRNLSRNKVVLRIFASFVWRNWVFR